MEQVKQEKEEKQTRFDGWENFETVDCNNCKWYRSYDCSGMDVGSVRICKSYKATRGTNLETYVRGLNYQIEIIMYDFQSIQSKVNTMKWLCILGFSGFVISVIVGIRLFLLINASLAYIAL